MKTKILFSTTALLLFLSVNAQIHSSSGEKMNIVKTNLTAYAFRNYNITYERSITKWLSLNVSYGNMPEGKIPFLDMFLSGGERQDFQDIKMSGSQLTIEPRFYLGSRGYGKGFYIAPYYRYSTYTLGNAVYDFYSENTQQDIPLQLSGKASGNSVGLMIGCQWFLGKKDNWVLDFWIIGGHYGKGKGNFEGTSDKVLTPQEQQELQESLQAEDIPVVEYSVTTSNRGAAVTLDGPWAGLRSGLSFGYRF